MIVTVILIIALVCFLAAMLDWPPSQHSRLIAAGLFFWLLATLITQGVK